METEKLVRKIRNEELRRKCFFILSYVEKKYNFSEKPAAKNHHHNYKCGLDIHTAEVIRFSLKLNKLLKKPFPEDEIILVAFLHDLMKAYEYGIDKEGNISIISFPCSGEAIVFRLCMKAGLVLTMEQISSCEYAHGGWSTQAQNKHIQPSKLSSLLHCADLLSANFGKCEIKNKAVM